MRLRPLALLPALAVLLLALSGPGLAAQVKGSDTKGKYYFKKSCKACHAGKGEAPVLSPLSRTQGQWRKFFQGGKHGKGGTPLSPKFGPPEQILDIQTFLINHASDSPQPETCGG